MIFEEMFSQPLCNLMILYSVDLSVPTVILCLLSLSFFVFFSALRGRHRKDKEHILLIVFFHSLSVLYSHVAGLALNVQLLLPQTQKPHRLSYSADSARFGEGWHLLYM